MNLELQMRHLPHILDEYRSWSIEGPLLFGLFLLFCLLTLFTLENSPHLANSLTNAAEDISTSKAPALDPYGIYEKIHERPVTDAEGQEYAEIAPSLLICDVKRRKVLVSDRIWAILAVCCGGRVDEIATCALGERAGISTASLSWWRIEACRLRIRALDWYVVECGCEDATDPVCRRIDIIHPAHMLATVYLTTPSHLRNTYQYFQNTGKPAYGLTTPLNKENMTKKNGKTLEMTVKEGANAQIHWPQLA